MRLPLGVLIVAAAVATAGSQADQAKDTRSAGGVLRGRVAVQHPLTASHPPEPDGAMIPAEVRREAVVFLEDPPPGDDAPKPMRARLRQVNETFVPHLVAVTVGSTVDFPNDDRTYHNVFSLSKPKRFDLGRYAAGQSKAVVFDKAGIVRVFCDIHSHMNAFVLVFSHRYFAVTDARGQYRIDQVPPGTYQVTAWYEGIAQRTERVTIAVGAATDTDFSIR